MATNEGPGFVSKATGKWVSLTGIFPNPRGEALRFLERGLATIQPDDPCPTWPYTRVPKGYPRIFIDGNHRLVCHVVLERTGRGPRPAGMECCHSCGNGHLGCWHPGHLRWDTHLANMAEARAQQVDQNSKCKLSIEQVRLIRALSYEETYTQMAKNFGVSPETVRQVRTGVSWRHVY